jgi:glycosyltransferase involved in cell wall biosynthesis
MTVSPLSDEGTPEGRISWVRDHRSPEPVAISLVIVTYNNGKGLLECLQSIRAQIFRAFEIIIVDNGNTGKYADKISGNYVYIRLGKNYGINVGRNVGARFSRADILAFLDDDCILEVDHLGNSVDFLDRKGCYGFRGRIRPRTRSIYNVFQSHYDLGDDSFPHLINTEGNCVLRKECLFEVGGWEESLDFAGGHEGLLLSYKLVSRYGREGLRYFPDAIIRHDFSDSFLKIIKKDLRHDVFSRKLLRERPELRIFRESYATGSPLKNDLTGDSSGWGARLARSARENILGRPILKQFLYQYFYQGKREAFRGFCMEMTEKIGRACKG